jgi:hypothetical protein
VQYIRFNYLYRDFSNYKNHGSIIFSNPNNLSLEEIDSEIRKHLLDEIWFIHSKWNLPDLHFEKTDWKDDHAWHEYEGVEIIRKCEGEINLPIEEFLQKIHNGHSQIPSRNI